MLAVWDLYCLYSGQSPLLQSLLRWFCLYKGLKTQCRWWGDGFVGICGGTCKEEVLGKVRSGCWLPKASMGFQMQGEGRDRPVQGVCPLDLIPSK